MHTTILFAFLLVGCTALQWTLQSNLTGQGFFDQMDFYADWDPTYGYVDYVDRPTAEALKMMNNDNGVARFGAEATKVLDPNANLGRKSIRLTSKRTWTHGLFVLDLAHMPGSVCGTWPAFWMLGNGPLLWPTYGEMDIIEFTNDAKVNLMALHTTPNCTIAGSGQTGTLLTNDCGAANGYKGCGVSPKLPNNAGTDFNANGGGVYAVEWTSTAIRVWFFPRNGIPSGIRSPTVDPAIWGPPTANFEGSCDIDAYFFNASMIFNIDFCGTWAGPTFNLNTSCPVLSTNQWTSCNMYVAGSPQAFSESYWAGNYLAIYQTAPGLEPPPPSSLSSVVPAESSRSVTASGAQGRSTTTTTTMTPLPASSFTTSILPASSISSTISTVSPPTSPSIPIVSSPAAATTQVVVVVTSVVTISHTTAKVAVITPATLRSSSSACASASPLSDQ